LGSASGPKGPKDHVGARGGACTGRGGPAHSAGPSKDSAGLRPAEPVLLVGEGREISGVRLLWSEAGAVCDLGFCA